MFDEKEGPPPIIKFRLEWCEWYAKKTGCSVVDAYKEFAQHTRVYEARRVRYQCTESRKRHDTTKAPANANPLEAAVAGIVYTQLVIRLYQRGNHA